MRAIVLGAGGFIGNHLVSRLKSEGYYVKGVDLKHPLFSSSAADDFVIGDLRDKAFCDTMFSDAFDEVYQLAADMGGAGYLFTGENDFNVMHHSAQINLNVAQAAIQLPGVKLFYSSSACIYPRHNQNNPLAPNCEESSAYPADPDSEYGWEKLFSERLYLNACSNYNLNVRLARFHNVYGPENDYNSGKEKAPAAVCRKVAMAPENGTVEIWGDGQQTRSFLFVEDCIEGIRKLMQSDFHGPVNIGSEEMISINDFARLVIGISGKQLEIRNTEGPVGVMGRTSNNTLVVEKTGWEPAISLEAGMQLTYNWMVEDINRLAAELIEQTSVS